MPAATACARVKPSMQLYRPPTLRAPDDVSNSSYSYEGSNNGFDGSSASRPGLNINAKEFVSLSISTPNNSYNNGGGQACFSGPNGATPSALKHSKSAGKVVPSYGAGLHHSRSGGQLGVARGKERSNGGGSGTSPPLRVHFTDDTIAFDPDDKAGMIQRSPNTSGSYCVNGAAAIKRSKSLGSAADLGAGHSNGSGGLLPSPPSPSGDSASLTSASNAISEMAPLPEDVVKKFQEVLKSSNNVTARIVMEVVKELFNKIVQGTKFAEPAARYCIAIIEMEESAGQQTFLETLLNTCQEYYQEREKLLRPPPPTPTSTRLQAPPITHTKWVAYMTFLHEMYTQVKRRQRTVVSSTAPRLLLLTLLAECCVVSLEDHATGGASLTQTECLFFILTGVGRDIEVELPPVMSNVMAAAREGLFASSKTPAIKKTLLQLIEMNAASWQLPAQAVMYYYPTVGGK